RAAAWLSNEGQVAASGDGQGGHEQEVTALDRSTEVGLATQVKRDYYEILGVRRTASEHEIKDTFLKLAAEFQAAGKPENIEAVESFREIARAYRVLIDPEQRRSYDQFGESATIGQKTPSGYDLDELERRSRTGAYCRWQYCDPGLAMFLDKL